MAELKISSEEIRDALAQFRDSYDPNATPVSYTHLTLPTSDLV